jgi:hypothetical protein
LHVQYKFDSPSIAYIHCLHKNSELPRHALKLTGGSNGHVSASGLIGPFIIVCGTVFGSLTSCVDDSNFPSVPCGCTSTSTWAGTGIGAGTGAAVDGTGVADGASVNDDTGVGTGMGGADIFTGTREHNNHYHYIVLHNYIYHLENHNCTSKNFRRGLNTN